MFEVKAWYWLAAAMVLIMLELVVPSFTIVWFGLGALIVALLMWMSPDIALSTQLFTWAIASIIFTACWFLLIRPKMEDKTKAGISLEAVLGESGLVVRVPVEQKRGTVKFTTPLLGAEEWQFICENQVSIGDRVTVIDISGNTLVVKSNKEN